MKTLMIMMACIVSLTLVSACQVTAKDKNTSISVNNDDGYNHCPPGHAKKGWC